MKKITLAALPVDNIQKTVWILTSIPNGLKSKIAPQKVASKTPTKIAPKKVKTKTK